MANHHYSKLYSTFIKQHRKKHAAGSFLMGFNVYRLLENSDSIDKNIETVRKAELNKEEETGMDRLRIMFKKDEYGDISPELQMVIQGVTMGLFFGTMIGGSIYSRESYLRFIETNQATTFYGHVDAKKRLQDKVFVGFFRGAWKWGWRLSLFTGSMIFVTTTISVYRGKSSLLEYIAGGAVSGSMYKFKSGPKATIAGGAVGGILGAVAGSLSLAIMYLTGTSMEEIRYWQYKWKEEYQQSKVERLRAIREKEKDPMLTGHDQVLLKNELLQSLDEAIKKGSSSSPEPPPASKSE
ncbi:RPII140-upstream gene protein [Palaemon carinicauda]|uniref:RPII140-upstream gene protein n=1 Tax=Palaemon carinicauda TaxID=392227 RepID=UPI0035B67E42